MMPTAQRHVATDYDNGMVTVLKLGMYHYLG
jgi:hypothetical protein